MKTDDELKKDLKRICRLMRKLIKDAGPSGIYLANSTFNLMRGPHHLPGVQAKPNWNPHAVIASETVSGADGGDW